MQDVNDDKFKIGESMVEINDENFFMTYGDGLADINLTKLEKFHLKNKKIVTVTAVHPPARFGELKLNKRHEVVNFKEKPQADGSINMGYMVLDYEVFEYIDENSVFEEEPLKKLAKSGNLYSFSHEGYFQPMDTYRENLALNNIWDKGLAPWKIWE